MNWFKGVLNKQSSINPVENESTTSIQDSHVQGDTKTTTVQTHILESSLIHYGARSIGRSDVGDMAIVNSNFLGNLGHNEDFAIIYNTVIQPTYEESNIQCRSANAFLSNIAIECAQALGPIIHHMELQRTSSSSSSQSKKSTMGGLSFRLPSTNSNTKPVINNTNTNNEITIQLNTCLAALKRNGPVDKRLSVLMKMTNSEMRAKIVNQSHLPSLLLKIINSLSLIDEDLLTKTITNNIKQTKSSSKFKIPKSRKVEFSPSSSRNDAPVDDDDDAFMISESSEQKEIETEKKDDISIREDIKDALLRLCTFSCSMCVYTTTPRELVSSNCLVLLFDIMDYNIDKKHPFIETAKDVALSILVSLVPLGCASQVQIATYLHQKGAIAKLIKATQRHIIAPKTTSPSFVVDTFGVCVSFIQQTCDIGMNISEIFIDFAEEDAYFKSVEIAVWLHSLNNSIYRMKQRVLRPSQVKDSRKQVEIKTRQEILLSESLLYLYTDVYKNKTDEEKHNEALSSLDKLLTFVTTLVFVAPTALPVLSPQLRKQSNHMAQALTSLPDQQHSRLRNLEAVNVLLAIFVKLPEATDIQMLILNELLALFSGHSDNYWLMHSLQPLPLFLGMLPSLNIEIQTMLVSILDYTVGILGCVPLQELEALVDLLRPVTHTVRHMRRVQSTVPRGATKPTRKIRRPSYSPNRTDVVPFVDEQDYPLRDGSPDAMTTVVLLKAVREYVNIDNAYSDTFRNVGMIDILCQHLAELSTVCEEKYAFNNNNHHQQRQQEQNKKAQRGRPTPACFDLNVFSAALKTMLVLVEKNEQNLQLFREIGGAQSLYSLLSTDTYRVISLQFLSKQTDKINLMALMEVLQCAASKRNPRMQCDLICCLNRMMKTETVKTLWREDVAGNQCIFSIVSFLASVFDDETELGKQDHYKAWMDVFRSLFCLLKTSLENHPINRAHFQNSGGWNFFMDAIVLTDILSSQLSCHAIQCIMDLCIETTRPWEMKQNKKFSIDFHAEEHNNNNNNNKDNNDDEDYNIRVLTWDLPTTEFTSANSLHLHALQERKNKEKGNAQEMSIMPIIRNPSCIKLLIDLSIKCSIDVRLMILHSLHQLFAASALSGMSQNLHAVSELGILEHFITIYGAYIHRKNPSTLANDLHPFNEITDFDQTDSNTLDKCRIVCEDIVESLATYSLSPEEARQLLHVFPADSLPLHLLRISLSGRQSLSYFEFEHATTGDGYIDIPRIDPTLWPSNVGTGLSFVCWINIRDTTKLTHSGLDLASLEEARARLRRVVHDINKIKSKETTNIVDNASNAGFMSSILNSFIKQETTEQVNEQIKSRITVLQKKERSKIHQECVINLFEFSMPDNSILFAARIIDGYMNARVTVDSKAHIISDLIFHKFKFEKKRWYHVVVSQERKTKIEYSFSLYVNGEKVDSAVAPYIKFPIQSKILKGTMIKGVFGTNKVSSRSTDRMLSWWLRTPILTQQVLQPHEIFHMHQRGVNYNGTFSARRQYNVRVVDLVSKNNDIGADAMYEAPVIDNNKFLLAYQARLSCQIVGTQEDANPISSTSHSCAVFLKTFQARSVISPEVFEECSIGNGSFLMNAYYHPKPLGYLRGGCSAVQTTHIADALRSVGSFRVLFPLVSRANSSIELEIIVLLIVSLLYQNEKNMKNMAEIHGYKLLSFLMRSKVKYFTEEILDLFMTLVLGESLEKYRDEVTVVPIYSSKYIYDSYDEYDYFYFENIDQESRNSGLELLRRRRSEDQKKGGDFLANLLALQHIILDYSLWKHVTPTLQCKLFQRLADLASIGPKLGEMNTILTLERAIFPNMASFLSFQRQLSGIQEKKNRNGRASTVQAVNPTKQQEHNSRTWNAGRLNYCEIVNVLLEVFSGSGKVPREILEPTSLLLRISFQDELTPRTLACISSWLMMGLGYTMGENHSQTNIMTNTNSSSSSAAGAAAASKSSNRRTTSIGNSNDLSIMTSTPNSLTHSYLLRNAESETESEPPVIVEVACNIFMNLLYVATHCPRDTRLALFCDKLDLYWFANFYLSSVHPLVVSWSLRLMMMLLHSDTRYYEHFLRFPSQYYIDSYSMQRDVGFQMLSVLIPTCRIDTEAYTLLFGLLMGKMPLFIDNMKNIRRAPAAAFDLLWLIQANDKQKKNNLNNNNNNNNGKNDNNNDNENDDDSDNEEMGIRFELIREPSVYEDSMRSTNNNNLDNKNMIVDSNDNINEQLHCSEHPQLVFVILQSIHETTHDLLVHYSKEYKDGIASTNKKELLLTSEEAFAMSRSLRYVTVEACKFFSSMYSESPMLRMEIMRRQNQGSIVLDTRNPLVLIVEILFMLQNRIPSVEFGVEDSKNMVKNTTNMSDNEFESLYTHCIRSIDSIFNLLVSVMKFTLLNDSKTAFREVFQFIIDYCPVNASQKQIMSFYSRLFSSLFSELTYIFNNNAHLFYIRHGIHNLEWFLSNIIMMMEVGQLKFVGLEILHLTDKEVLAFTLESFKFSLLKIMNINNISELTVQIMTKVSKRNHFLQYSLRTCIHRLLVLLLDNSSKPALMEETLSLLNNHATLLLIGQCEKKYIYSIAYHLWRCLTGDQPVLKDAALGIMESLIRYQLNIIQDILQYRDGFMGPTYDLLTDGFDKLLDADYVAVSEWVKESVNNIDFVFKNTVFPKWRKLHESDIELRVDKRSLKSTKQREHAEYEEAFTSFFRQMRQNIASQRHEDIAYLQQRETSRQNRVRRLRFYQTRTLQDYFDRMTKAMSREGLLLEFIDNGIKAKLAECISLPYVRYHVDFTEGPYRQRKKMEECDHFYQTYGIDVAGYLQNQPTTPMKPKKNFEIENIDNNNSNDNKKDFDFTMMLPSVNPLHISPTKKISQGGDRRIRLLGLTRKAHGRYAKRISVNGLNNPIQTGQGVLSSPRRFSLSNTEQVEHNNDNNNDNNKNDNHNNSDNENNENNNDNEDDMGDFDRVVRLLAPTDEIFGIFPCSRVNGLNKHNAIAILTQNSLYCIDNFMVNEQGQWEYSPPEESSRLYNVSFERRPVIAPDIDNDENNDENNKKEEEKKHEKEVYETVLCVTKIPVSKNQTYGKYSDMLPTITSDVINDTTTNNNIEEKKHKHNVDFYLKVAYQDLREIYKRRYQLQNVGIEYFVDNGVHFLLAFESEIDRDSLYDDVMIRRFNQRNTIIKNTTVDLHMETLSQVKVEVENKSTLSRLGLSMNATTKRWRNGEMSNFAYLMYVNTLAGRSYNDITQYMIFPWILADYMSAELDLTDEKTFRDLSKCMGAQGIDRAKQFVERYENWEDPSGIIPKFHYGTHYSSAAIVLYFLIRMQPFTEAALQLQGGKFDHADRLFFDVAHSWKSASSEGGLSDVKELIPEFFYFPDFLLNLNRFDMGTHQNGKYLDHVGLPPWAKNDPRLFIELHRRALESSYVSSHLHEWIDLIFGYKQRGKEAIKAQNVFYYMTYEDAVDISSIDDPREKQATIDQIDNFGQTPHQVFKRPHPAREVFTSPSTVGSHCHLLRPATNQHHKEKKLSNRERINNLVWYNDKLIFSTAERALLGPNYSKCIVWELNTLSIRPLKINDHNVIATFENLHDADITCATSTDNGQYILTGGQDAVISVWMLNNNNVSNNNNTSNLNNNMNSNNHQNNKKDKYVTPPCTRLILLNSLAGHSSPITHIVTCSSFSLIISAAENNSIILWDLNRLVLTKRLPKLPSKCKAINVNVITGQLIICTDFSIFVWTVNGDLIAQYCVGTNSLDRIECVSFAASPDWTEEQVIITGHHNGSIRFFGLNISSSKENTQEINALISDKHLFPNGPGTDPYMQLYEKHILRAAHSYPITCVLTTHKDFKKMWTGDIYGNTIYWVLTNDDHWVKDADAKKCLSCQTKFGVLERRHHCRVCGGIFCGECSSKKMTVPELGFFEPVRVCNSCYKDHHMES